MMTPLSSSASLNALALLTASCPVIAIDDEIHLLGTDLLFDPLELVHQLFVDVQPAGRVENHRAECPRPGLSSPRSGRRAPGSVAPGSE